MKTYAGSYFLDFTNENNLMFSLLKTITNVQNNICLNVYSLLSVIPLSKNDPMADSCQCMTKPTTIL